MDSNKYISSLLASGYSNTSESVDYLELSPHFAVKPKKVLQANSLYKYLEYLQSIEDTFNHAVIVTDSGKRLCFDRSGFLGLKTTKTKDKEEYVDAPYTLVDTVTGITDPSVPLEDLPTVSLKEWGKDDKGILIQYDSKGHKYRNGKISYRVIQTEDGYYNEYEYDSGWSGNGHQLYKEETHAHREALFISKGSQLFYRPTGKLQYCESEYGG